MPEWVEILRGSSGPVSPTLRNMVSLDEVESEVSLNARKHSERLLFEPLSCCDQVKEVVN